MRRGPPLRRHRRGSTAELHHLFAAGSGDYIDTIAVGDDTHIVLPLGTPAHYGNHSREPNLWSGGAYEFATPLPVDPGDELTIDYGTISDDAIFRMLRSTCSTRSQRAPCATWRKWPAFVVPRRWPSECGRTLRSRSCSSG